MSDKPHQRRGLGRGLGSLIPTGPRHERVLESVDLVPATDLGDGDRVAGGEGLAGGEGPESEESTGSDTPVIRPLLTRANTAFPASERTGSSRLTDPADDRTEDPDGSFSGPLDRTSGGSGTALERGTGPVGGTADWIGLPLPGDDEPTAEGMPGFDSESAGVAGALAPASDGRRRSSREISGGGSAQAHSGDTTLPGAEAQTEPGDQFASERQAHNGSGPDGGLSSASAREPVRETPGDTEQRTSGDSSGTHQGGRQTSGAAGLRSVEGAWFAQLPIDDISPNPRQPREVFDEESMAELVASIHQVGLLQPVVVRPVDGDRYELVMGERRWRATQQAGLLTIPAIVRETGDDELLRDALLENLHRAQLNALEEAAAYQQLLEDFGCTHDELAQRIGRSRPQISNTIRLLKLSPAVQRRVAAGVLSAGHARALLAVEDADVQDRLAGRVVAEGLSVRSLEEIVAVGDLGSGPHSVQRRSRPSAPGVDDLAHRLSDVLETRVRVDLGKRKGRITVEFASLPDLERIVGVIDPGHTTRHHGDT
jgi:ParB family chromosome partitioning protein